MRAAFQPQVGSTRRQILWQAPYAVVDTVELLITPKVSDMRSFTVSEDGLSEGGAQCQ